jgi:hypothetical protein
MNNSISYLNTDLDLVSSNDLTELVKAFEVRDVFSLHVTHDDDGQWYATLETDREHLEPESNIAEMLGVLECLGDPLRNVWDLCTLREFNIGYNCGAKPWSFNQGLSNALLNRIAAAGASLRITLYPDRDEQEGKATDEARIE